MVVSLLFHRSGAKDTHFHNSWKDNWVRSERTWICTVGQWFCFKDQDVVKCLIPLSMATHSSVLAWRIPTDRGAWWAIVHGVEESDMTEWACVRACACAHTHTHTVQFNKLFLFILLKVPETKWITKCF